MRQKNAEDKCNLCILKISDYRAEKKRLRHRRSRYHHLSCTLYVCVHVFPSNFFRAKQRQHIYFIWLLTIQNRQLFTTSYYLYTLSPSSSSFFSLCVSYFPLFMLQNRSMYTKFIRKKNFERRFFYSIVVVFVFFRPLVHFICPAVYSFGHSVTMMNNICITIINNCNNNEKLE